ncbi:MAG: ferrous iron transport protein A [Kosmotoga sp.]|nr:MAG: ferrous iron transport protein A [Kosmotoga sp.]
MICPLSELPAGATGEIIKINLPDRFSERLYGLGFVRGEQVEVIRKAPLGDPTVYRIKGTEITLRDSQASQIFVKSDIINLSAAHEGEYVVDFLNGGYRFRENVNRMGIRPGKWIRVLVSHVNRKFIETSKGKFWLPYGKSKKIFVKESGYEKKE